MRNKTALALAASLLSFQVLAAEPPRTLVARIPDRDVRIDGMFFSAHAPGARAWITILVDESGMRIGSGSGWPHYDGRMGHMPGFDPRRAVHVRPNALSYRYYPRRVVWNQDGTETVCARIVRKRFLLTRYDAVYPTGECHFETIRSDGYFNVYFVPAPPPPGRTGD